MRVDTTGELVRVHPSCLCVLAAGRARPRGTTAGDSSSWVGDVPDKEWGASSSVLTSSLRGQEAAVDANLSQARMELLRLHSLRKHTPREMEPSWLDAD